MSITAPAPVRLDQGFENEVAAAFRDLPQCRRQEAVKHVPSACNDTASPASPATTFSFAAATCSSLIDPSSESRQSASEPCEVADRLTAS
jgi:hypothetical protein